MLLSRKREFRIALAIAGINAVDFAKTHSVTRSAVNQVVRGEANSKRINMAIDDFIYTQFNRVGISPNRSILP